MAKRMMYFLGMAAGVALLASASRADFTADLIDTTGSDLSGVVPGVLRVDLSQGDGGFCGGATNFVCRDDATDNINCSRVFIDDDGDPAFSLFRMMTFDLGSAKRGFRMFTAIDHWDGNPASFVNGCCGSSADFVTQDVMEYSVWGTNVDPTADDDGNGVLDIRQMSSWKLLSDVVAFDNTNTIADGHPTFTFDGDDGEAAAAPVAVYINGSALCGAASPNGHGYSRDYVFCDAYRFVGVRTSSISLALNDADPEVDGVFGFDPEESCAGFNLDIKPGSCPNSFNRNSHGVLPVALVGTDSFDVSEVDLASIQLCRADGLAACVAPHAGPPGPHSEFEDVATPFPGELCDCHELTGDGITDLSMKFKTDDLVAALQMDDFSPGALVELTVFGETLDGAPFEASDCVRLVPPGSPPGLLAVLQPSAGQAYVEVSPLDDQLDGGGFGDFERTFPQSTVSTLEAAVSAGQKQLVGWKLDGVFETTDVTFGVTVEGMSQTIEAVYRLPGDIIADDAVNLVDFAQFANCYGQTAGTASCAAEFHAASDLNRDGRVDLLDFSIFALNFGQ